MDNNKKNGDILKKFISDWKQSYNFETKDKFHRKGLKTLRALGEVLNLEPKDYRVSSNKGGNAVLGEVTFHCDFFYLQIGDFPHMLFRACNGQKDYSGKQNFYLNIEKLNNLNEMAQFILNNPKYFLELQPEFKDKYDSLHLKEKFIKDQPTVKLLKL